MSTLVFAVPRGRAFCGRAVLLGSDGTLRAGPFRALATASARVAKKNGNAEVSALLPFGHPPTGTYVVAASLPPGYVHSRRARRFGRVGALLLRALTGDAVAAERNGRGLIAIHGGPRDKSGLLRPTRGGIRLSNTKMSALIRAINAAQLDDDPVDRVQIVEVEPITPAAADAMGTHDLGPRGKRPAGTGATPMFLLPLLSLGELGSGSKLARRDVLRAALVAAGAIAIQACDRASPCEPYGCEIGDGGAPDAAQRDAGDAGCDTSGYTCGTSGGVG